MRDDDDDPLNAEARLLLRHATVSDLKSDAIETARWFAGLNEYEKARLLILLDEDGPWCVVRSGP
jgi:hypothetical protein